ncbi:MAG TPA: bifunctional 3,4-dihydroxy-2-butanone-4-phosphate synthase/GTP cyclohydrolase II [Planctomycetota bacterium]|nr:bifunctional 3,4-dihydroxy-2-butanone-4-phosphate synthase/GTP cyclohydrolase II [Planctomycetota bacterium]HRR80800.1 bifunctional 3,4-dihydroxy-2-butanone-4-phosphate synthase/GTP cyclohydrolase II [Planctomycetota bacterium]HRT94040.1 bifunctional 3,4-dihydroxy-2-butanone-4-phosphate synthase/GTP cyclohydrolase II [Planctomycetota bacterium]
MSRLSSIEEAVRELQAGRMIILVDDESRENEGDLVLAADKVTPEAIAFMAKHGSGLICLALTAEKVDELQLPLQPQRGPSRYGTAFTVSIEAREGISTGISAHDRATTIRTAVAPHCKPSDLCTPGHVFPLRAREGGVLARAGQTEGSVDLCRIAGLTPAGVICEVMNDDGTMARMPQLEKFAERHSLRICTVADIIEYRRRTETLIRRAVSPVRLPTLWGTFELLCYESQVDADPHLALTKGLVFNNAREPQPLEEPVLVRVHSECITGDTLGSLRCDCGAQLHAALEQIEAEGRGVLLYMRQEGRGIGLANKLRAYLLQEQGLDTVEANVRLGFKADLRDYGIGAQILRDLGLRRIRLLTNNPKKLHALAGFGLEVVEQVPLVVRPTEHNRQYLEAKKRKLGHTLRLD